MKSELIDAQVCYQQAEQRANDYYKLLYEQLLQKSYIPRLTKDIESWKHNHIRQHSLFSKFSRGKKKQTDPKDYLPYIKWLNYSGKLDSYLNRSMSYIYMRDLGKALDSPSVQERLKEVVGGLKNHLLQKNQGNADSFSMAGLYRLAQNHGVESTMIWLLDKLKTVSSRIPEGMSAEHAQRKLIKIIAGVVMYEIEELSDSISEDVKKQKLSTAIKLGYSYGLTYPFIDDLLDANILSAKEKQQYSDMIRTALITGSVPGLGKWTGPNKDLITYIHKELREAFDYIKSHQQPHTIKHFFEQAYVFFHSQEVDRTKELINQSYTNEELFIPIILKSSSSRLIVRSVLNASEDEGFDKRAFYYGIYNQLSDDFSDMFDDMEEGAVTPYTYYWKYHKVRSDLINPFELYWTVISHLIHDVYKSDPHTREVILDRAINGLKRYKERMGTKKYNEVMEIFFSGVPKFNRLIQKLVEKADDVDFFDKLLRDHMVTVLKEERVEQEEFLETIKNVRNQINNQLHISKQEQDILINTPIIDAANYSLEGDGKRLRPILTWVMGVKGYGLGEQAIFPLLKSLEYMHTASLIFDDLPSQDNAAIRRGRPTLHQMYNEATAELTTLFLTQKAIEEQTSLDFDAKTVLSLIQYTAQMTADMCKGQIMDLESKGKQLTLAELNTMSYFKTGLAFEAALILPAILGRAEEKERDALKKFAHHAGIAFQVKDDLLDVEGDSKLLGKMVGKDAENYNSTFVSILGIEEARKMMWEHYCQAIESLQEVPRNTAFLKHLMNYIVNRDH